MPKNIRGGRDIFVDAPLERPCMDRTDGRGEVRVLLQPPRALGPEPVKHRVHRGGGWPFRIKQKGQRSRQRFVSPQELEHLQLTILRHGRQLCHKTLCEGGVAQLIETRRASPGRDLIKQLLDIPAGRVQARTGRNSIEDGLDLPAHVLGHGLPGRRGRGADAGAGLAAGGPGLLPQQPAATHEQRPGRHTRDQRPPHIARTPMGTAPKV
jgi:hypothetical protein